MGDAGRPREPKGLGGRGPPRSSKARGREGRARGLVGGQGVAAPPRPRLAPRGGSEAAWPCLLGPVPWWSRAWEAEALRWPPAPPCPGRVPSRARGSGASRRRRGLVCEAGGCERCLSRFPRPARLTEPSCRACERSSPTCFVSWRAGSCRDNGICLLSRVAIVNYAFLVASVINCSGAERMMNYDTGCATYCWRRQYIKVWPMFLFLFLENRRDLMSFLLFSYILEHRGHKLTRAGMMLLT